MEPGYHEGWKVDDKRGKPTQTAESQIVAVSPQVSSLQLTNCETTWVPLSPSELPFLHLQVGDFAGRLG